MENSKYFQRFLSQIDSWLSISLQGLFQTHLVDGPGGYFFRKRLQAVPREKPSGDGGNGVNMLRMFGWVVMALALAGSAVRAEVVANVQFGEGPSGGNTPQYTGAAVVGSAGDQWNLVTSYPGGTPRALVNTSGNASGISMTSTTTSGSNFYNSNNAAWNSSPYKNLMQSYSTNVTSTSSNKNLLTFTGMNTSQKYDVYIYTQGNVTGRQLGVTLGGNSVTSNASNSNASTFILNQNYLYFSNMQFGTGSMALQYWSAAGEADINGIQIVAVPEPGTLVLGGIAAACGGGGVWWRRRRRSGGEVGEPA